MPNFFGSTQPSVAGGRHIVERTLAELNLSNSLWLQAMSDYTEQASFPPPQWVRMQGVQDYKM